MKPFAGGVRYKVKRLNNFPKELGPLLAAHAFVVPVRSDWESCAGWVPPTNPIDIDFGKEDWLFDPYVHFCLRIDTRKVSAPLLRAHVDKRCAEWKAENNRPKVPASVKREIKEGLWKLLIEQAPTKMEVIPVVWETSAGWLLFHSYGERQNDLFRKTFLATFGEAPEMITLKDTLSDEALDELLDLPPADFRSCAS